MGRGDVVKLTVDIQGRVTGLQEELDKVRKELNGLKGPENVTDSLKSGFKEVEEKLKKIKEYTENNQLNIADKKKLESELRDVENKYKSLMNNLSKNQKKFSLINTPKELTDAKKAMGDYEAEIDKANKELQEQQKILKENLATQENLVKSLKRKVSSAKGGETKANKGKVVAQDNVNVIRDAYNRKREEYINNGATEAQADVYLKNSNLARDLAQAEKELADAEEKVREARQKSYEILVQLSEAEQNYDKSSDETKGKLEELQKQFDELESNQFKKLKDIMVELSHDTFNFGFNPEEIQNVEEFKQKLQEIDDQNFEHIRPMLEALIKALKNGAEASREMNEEQKENVKTSEDFNKSIDRLKERTKTFFGLTNAIHLFRRAVRSAFSTVKDLDEVMTSMAVVTNYQISDLWQKLPEYTERANELGVTIHDAYEAMTIFLQQGLEENRALEISNETLKMARIAGLNAADATDRMTNALRGFNMELDATSAQRVDDVYNNLAAKSAANVDDISKAMTKVASLAHSANMEFENTAAFLTQIIETTRESAETAGTALKTVVARFSEVKKLYKTGDLLGSDEEGEEIDVNKISTALRTAGINLNEYFTGAKGLDQIFIDLASKWDDLDEVQKRYIATQAAGSRQQSRFLAMMSDYKRTQELVGYATNASGFAHEQFAKTLDSLKAKLAQLENAWNTFLMGIANNKIIKGAIDLLTELITKINDFTDSLPGVSSGLSKLLVAFGGLKLIGVVISKTIEGVATHLLHVGSAASSTKKVIEEIGKNGETVTETVTKQTVNATKKTGLLKTALSGLGKVFLKAGAKDAIAGATGIGKLGAAILGLNSVALGATAALAGIIYIYKKIKSDSPEAQLKRDKETLENLSKAAEQAAQDYESLKTSLSSLSTQQETIKNLTVGTDEWKESVRSLNEEVLTLISLYPELNDIANFEDGILTLDKNKLPDILSKYQQRASGLQFAKNIANQKVKNDELEVYLKEEGFQKRKDTFGNWLGHIVENVKSAWNSGKNGYFYEDQYRDLQEAAKLAAQGNKEEALKLVDNSGIAIGFEHLVEIGNKILEVEKEKAVYDKTNVATAVNNAHFEREEYSKYASNWLEPRAQGFRETVAKEVESLDDDQIKKEYLDILGLTEDKYQEKFGQELTVDAAKTGLIGLKAQEKMTKEVENFFNNVYSNLPEILQKLYQKEKGGALTGKDFEVIRSYATETDEIEKRKQYYGLIEKGYTSEQINDLKLAYNNSGAIYDDYFKKLGDIPNILQDTLKTFTAEEIKAFYNITSDFINNEQFLDSIENYLSTLNDRDREKFLKEFKAVDLTNINSINSLGNSLKEAGFEADINSDAFKNLTAAIIEVTGAVRKYTSTLLEGQLGKTATLMKDLRSNQDKKNITDEQYKELIKLLPELSQKFYQSGEKEYTYTGKEGLYNYIQNTIPNIVSEASKQGELSKQGLIYAGQMMDASVLGQYIDSTDTFGFDALSNVLVTRAEQAGVATEAIERYTKALESENEVEIKSAAVNLGQVVSVYELAQARGIETEGLDELAIIQEKSGAITSKNIDLAYAYAEANAELNTGISEILSNFDTYDGVLWDSFDGLQKSQKGTAEYASSLSSLKSSLQKVLGTDTEFTDEFLEEENLKKTLDLVKKLSVAESGEAADEIVKELDAHLRPFLDVPKAIKLAPNFDEEEYKKNFGEFSTLIDDFSKNNEIVIGAEIKDEALIESLNKIATQAGWTTEQLKGVVDALGYKVTFKEEKMPYTYVKGWKYTSMGYNGMQQLTAEYATGYNTVSVPVIEGLTKVSGSSVNSSNLDDMGKNAKAAKGDKPSYWKNPYDELYNLNEKINESLRTREALERRYDQLLKSRSSSMKDIREEYKHNIEALREEADLQAQMAEGRLRQIANIGSEVYTDSEGNRATFSQLGVTKYASYDAATGQITIDWPGLEELEKSPATAKKGEAAEAYISQLEEWVQSYEEVRDKLWEIEDKMEAFAQQVIDSYLNFEDRVLDAVVTLYQKQIDEYSSLSDTIKESNDKILSNLQESIALSRQIRDNTKTEEELADKEQRLAYLQRDTSGANDLEAMKLQKEIEDARESYQDTLIDQAIEQLGKDNEKAALQREQQIEIMQATLEWEQEQGLLWDEVHTLMASAIDPETGEINLNSDLIKVLTDSEGWIGMSLGKQETMLDDVKKQIAESALGLEEIEAKYKIDANGDGMIVTDSKTQSYLSQIRDLANRYTTQQAHGSASGTSGGSGTVSNSSNSGSGGGKLTSAQIFNSWDKSIQDKTISGILQKMAAEHGNGNQMQILADLAGDNTITVDIGGIKVDLIDSNNSKGFSKDEVIDAIIRALNNNPTWAGIR